VAEIRRQFVSSELKLRLLDNEEHMFDAGLYVGLGGTVLSLVILALGVVKPGLMAAYSSTLFGILFVAILKICHVRPYRRQLILETGDRMNE
jgi:O-antigen/teichoic acid export membrane protein